MKKDARGFATSAEIMRDGWQFRFDGNVPSDNQIQLAALCEIEKGLKRLNSFLQMLFDNGLDRIIAKAQYDFYVQRTKAREADRRRRLIRLGLEAMRAKKLKTRRRGKK
jgi:hypothetical protein